MQAIIVTFRSVKLRVLLALFKIYMGKKKNEKNDKMEKSAEDYQAEYKNITIKTTDGSTIYGKINISEKERVSDIFISNKSYAGFYRYELITN